MIRFGDVLAQNLRNYLYFILTDRSTDGTASASTSQRVDFKFLTKPGYIVYLISNVLLMSGLFLPLIFLPETIQAKGLSSGVVNLVFLINGICQIVGRLFSGFCSSRKPLYATFIWSMYLIITGISLVMVPFCTQLGHFLAFSLISGFLMGKYIFKVIWYMYVKLHKQFDQIHI